MSTSDDHFKMETFRFKAEDGVKKHSASRHTDMNTKIDRDEIDRYEIDRDEIDRCETHMHCTHKRLCQILLTVCPMKSAKNNVCVYRARSAM